MARHRSVRGLNYDEDYDDYDWDVEQSSEDMASYGVSPGVVQQYMFDRSRSQRAMRDYVPGVREEEEEEAMDADSPDGRAHGRRQRLDSIHVQLPRNLSPDSERKLKECMETLRDVSAGAIPEPILLDAAIRSRFDADAACRIMYEEPPSSNPDVGVDADGDRRPLFRVDSGASTTSMEDLKQKLETIAVEEQKKSVSAAVPSVLVVQPPPGPVKAMSQTASSSKSGSSCSTPRAMISPSPSLSKPSPREPAKPKLDPVAEYEKERGSSEKQCLNLVVIGHVDAGKSTLMGHLLYKLGQVNQKTMHKYEQESKKVGKQSFAFAWVLDETGEERSRGITMDVGLSRFETPHRSVTLLDAPGHKDFIPNMITGVSQADVALLVVDATRGEFETGFESGGQTREHALLARSLGVSQIGVVINKLDNEKWSQARFDEIVHKLSSFLLKHVGIKEADVVYIPCSGLTGENLVSEPTVPELNAWYSGPTLMNVIDNFKPPERPIAKPFRMSITDVFKGVSSLVSVGGRVDCGMVQAGDRVLVAPQGEQCFIKAMVVENAAAVSSSGGGGNTTAFAGDQIVASLAGIDAQKLAVGSVLCDPAHPAQVASRFAARIVVFGIEVPITRGFPVIYHQNSFSEQAIVKKLLAVVHRSTGEIQKNRPRCLVKNSSALVVIEIARPICVELFKDVKELGRFTLRSGGTTIAAGMITEILQS